MMRILILIIMLLPCSLGMYASAIDSLLSVLDKTIVMRRQYEEEKERYISLIKDELKQGRLTDMERYLIQNRLFAEYNSYISDSALHYINENILIYNPQIQISVISGTKRSIFRQKNKTKRSKKRLHTTLIKPEQKVNEDLCSGFIVS